MKNITKRIIAIFAVLAVSATTFASCGEKKEKKPADPATQFYPFEVGSGLEDNELTPAPDVDLNAADPTAPAEDEEKEPATEVATEIQEATEADGQPATQYVAVTEASGEEATEAGGAVVTEAVKVTNVVTNVVTKPVEKPTTPPYTAKKDGRYAMWLDISKDANFFFEGDMIKATFKVKEGIPDGDYPIEIVPDLSDIAGVDVTGKAKVVGGTIRVNNGEIEAVDVSAETGMIFYGDQVACKQGDEIEFNINIKNNSGLAAFCVWFYFDSNALEFVEAVPTGEFEEIARDTEIGGKVKE